jgi:hypothetical protein
MKLNTFTYKCVELSDFCSYLGLDLDHALEDINDSEVTWGTNDDTLIRVDRLLFILGYSPPEAVRIAQTDEMKDLCVSLGG